MKTITLSQDAPAITELFDQARNEDVVVRLADDSEFLLAAIDESDVEVARSRKNQRLMQFLEARAQQTATVPLDELKQRLGL